MTCSLKLFLKGWQHKCLLTECPNVFLLANLHLNRHVTLWFSRTGDVLCGAKELDSKADLMWQIFMCVVCCSPFCLHSIIFVGEPTLLSGNEYYFECINVSDCLESLLEE